MVTKRKGENFKKNLFPAPGLSELRIGYCTILHDMPELPVGTFFVLYPVIPGTGSAMEFFAHPDLFWDSFRKRPARPFCDVFVNVAAVCTDPADQCCFVFPFFFVRRIHGFSCWDYQ